MAENIKMGWLIDKDESNNDQLIKFAPKTIDQNIYTSEGKKFVNELQNNLDTINTRATTVYYGTCNSLETASTKIVTLDDSNNVNDFQLLPGTRISVKFTNGNSCPLSYLEYSTTRRYLELNVNNLGKYKVTGKYDWVKNEYIDFIYSGTQWIVLNNLTKLNLVKPSEGANNYPLLYTTNIKTNNGPLLEPDVPYRGKASTTDALNEVYKDNNIYINPQDHSITATKFIGNLEGSATKLETARNIKLTGDVTDVSASFNGEEDIELNVSIIDDSHNHVIDNIDELQDNLDTLQDNIDTVQDNLDITNIRATTVYYGTCDSEANDWEKVITLDDSNNVNDFQLLPGTRISVKFTNGNNCPGTYNYTAETISRHYEVLLNVESRRARAPSFTTFPKGSIIDLIYQENKWIVLDTTTELVLSNSNQDEDFPILYTENTQSKIEGPPVQYESYEMVGYDDVQVGTQMVQVGQKPIYGSGGTIIGYEPIYAEEPIYNRVPKYDYVIRDVPLGITVDKIKRVHKDNHITINPAKNSITADKFIGDLKSDKIINTYDMYILHQQAKDTMEDGIIYNRGINFCENYKINEEQQLSETNRLGRIRSRVTGSDTRKSLMEIMAYNPVSREQYTPESGDPYFPFAELYVFVDANGQSEAGVRSVGGLAANSGDTYSSGNVVFMGAAWNDYAEFRDQIDTLEPGYCVASTDNGKVYKTTEKFQACDGIVSDTYGFAIGRSETYQTPLAVSGRVLAYCEGDRYNYHAGDTVCAGPEGKVCKMTREEIREWPDRIIGIVSEIPEYEEWNGKKINNRIWIKVK